MHLPAGAPFAEEPKLCLIRRIDRHEANSQIPTRRAKRRRRAAPRMCGRFESPKVPGPVCITEGPNAGMLHAGLSARGKPLSKACSAISLLQRLDGAAAGQGSAWFASMPSGSGRSAVNEQDDPRIGKLLYQVIARGVDGRSTRQLGIRVADPRL